MTTVPATDMSWVVYTMGLIVSVRNAFRPCRAQSTPEDYFIAAADKQGKTGMYWQVHATSCLVYINAYCR